MKSFIEYLTESKEEKKYSFKIKIAGDLPENCEDVMETALQKYKVGVKTNGFWLGTLSKYQQYGLPTENILNYETRLKSVSIADLTKLANKYFSSPNVLHALMMPETKK